MSDRVVMCVCPPVAPELFPPDGIVAVGFGAAYVARDGQSVWRETDDEPMMTGSMAEEMAALDPLHEWKICLYGPLASSVYRREAPGRWVLIEKGEGFA